MIEDNTMFKTKSRPYDGLFNFGIDVATLLMKDDDFFQKYITTIDPNDFSDEDTRYIIFTIKEFYLNYGVRASFNGLYEWVRMQAKNNIDLEERTERVKRMQHNGMSEERIKEVKTNYPYFGTQVKFWKLRNELNENQYGFENFQQMKTVIREVMRKARIMEDSLNELEGQINENKGNNVW